jgi:tRNA pseudouridine55 synthase
MDGILNIHKATGMTSHDVVARVRKIVKQRRVGHAGTLDPAASGVLPICIGQGTRVAEYLSESGKAYQAEIIFGTVTDTYDAEGEVIRTSDWSQLTLPQIEQAVQSFLGPQLQLPPRFSAIKIKGQPAYKLARAGSEVVLEARPITISNITISDWQAPRLSLGVECSKGTYIRSLAYDLGERVGTGAHLGGLVRTRSGPFVLEKSSSLEELAEAMEKGELEKLLFPSDFALPSAQEVRLDQATTDKVLHGNSFQAASVKGQSTNDLARVYDPAGVFLAIAQWDPEKQAWQPKKVLTGETK